MLRYSFFFEIETFYRCRSNIGTLVDTILIRRLDTKCGLSACSKRLMSLKLPKNKILIKQYGFRNKGESAAKALLYRKVVFEINGQFDHDFLRTHQYKCIIPNNINCICYYFTFTY